MRRSSRLFAGIGLATALVMLAIGFGNSTQPAVANPGITPGVLPIELAAALDVPGTDIVLGRTGTGDSDSRGFAMADSALAFFPVMGDSFVILSSGLAESADDPDENNDEAVGDGFYSDDVSTQLDGLNTSQGEDLVQFTLGLMVPADKNCLSFHFAFFSEEFPDWIGQEFNDTFIAELGPPGAASTFTIVGSEVNAPNNIAFDPNGEVLDVNSGFGFDPNNPNPDTGTTYDGTSGLLNARAAVTPGSEGDLVFSIMDLGDSILDSAVFLDNFQWLNVPAEECAAGVSFLLGDADCSLLVDIVDALFIAQDVVGLIPGLLCTNAADVNGDTAIDILDALLIAQLVVGLITEFPAETAAG